MNPATAQFRAEWRHVPFSDVGGRVAKNHSPGGDDEHNEDIAGNPKRGRLSGLWTPGRELAPISTGLDGRDRKLCGLHLRLCGAVFDAQGITL